MSNKIFLCLYCNKPLDKDYLNNKIGEFCDENHYEEYIKSLSNEEYINIMHKLCT